MNLKCPECSGVSGHKEWDEKTLEEARKRKFSPRDCKILSSEIGCKDWGFVYDCPKCSKPILSEEMVIMNKS